MPATGTRRRLQALAYMGHPLRDVAARLRTPAAHIERLASGTAAVADATLARAVRTLTHTLAGRIGPCQTTRAAAIAAGWYSVAAWDDLDDPDCPPVVHCDDPRYQRAVSPDEVAVDRAVEHATRGRGDGAKHRRRAVPLTRQELAIAVRRMRAMGHRPGAITRRLSSPGRVREVLDEEVTDVDV